MNQTQDKFNWHFLIENKEAVLSIFSTHYPFNSSQLIKFKNLLHLGQTYEISNGYELWYKPGLIFNDNINWTKYIQNLFQRPKSEVPMYDGGCYILEPLDFSKIPYSRIEALTDDNDIFLAKQTDCSEDAETFYEVMIKETLLRHTASYRYSLSEIKSYVSNTGDHSLIMERFNRNLFLQFYDILLLVIPNYTVDIMLERFK